MYIKLTKIDYDADMGGYDAVEVFGTKLEDGKKWSKTFFANNGDLLNQLEEFSVGEEVNVVLEQNKKNKKWWNIVGFKEMTDQDRENLENPKSHTNRGSGKSEGTPAKSSGLTKEEWAEKDRAKAVSIAKGVAVKIAAQAGKTTPKAVIKFADELLPYLLNTDSPKAETSDDPLDPGV